MLDDEKLSHVADWLLGPPLKILAILVLAPDRVGDALDDRAGVVDDRVVGDLDVEQRTRPVLAHVADPPDLAVGHVPDGAVDRALLDIEIAYDTVVEHARSVIKGVAEEVWAEDDGVLEEPELWGVEQLGANGVMLGRVVKTTPSQQWRVSRQLRERIKVAFDEEGIEIPFPQQTVWHKPAEVS